MEFPVKEPSHGSNAILLSQCSVAPVPGLRTAALRSQHQCRPGNLTEGMFLPFEISEATLKTFSDKTHSFLAGLLLMTFLLKCDHSLFSL